MCESHTRCMRLECLLYCQLFQVPEGSCNHVLTSLLWVWHNFLSFLLPPFNTCTFLLFPCLVFSFWQHLSTRISSSSFLAFNTCFILHSIFFESHFTITSSFHCTLCHNYITGQEMCLVSTGDKKETAETLVGASLNHTEFY